MGLQSEEQLVSQEEVSTWDEPEIQEVVEERGIQEEDGGIIEELSRFPLLKLFLYKNTFGYSHQTDEHVIGELERKIEADKKRIEVTTSEEEKARLEEDNAFRRLWVEFTRKYGKEASNHLVIGLRRLKMQQREERLKA